MNSLWIARPTAGRPGSVSAGAGGAASTTGGAADPGWSAGFGSSPASPTPSAVSPTATDTIASFTFRASVPIATVIGIGVGLLISGVIVTETVFAIPGIGRLTVDAILRRDYPVIQGIVLLFSFVYVLVNLLIDVTYTLVDPRIRY